MSPAVNRPDPIHPAVVRYRRLVGLIAAVACVTVWMSALAILSIGERERREELASELGGITRSTSEYIETLLAERQAHAAGMAALPGVAEAVEALAVHGDPTLLERSDDLLDAASQLGASQVGFVLASPEGGLLGSNIPDVIWTEGALPWEAGIEVLILEAIGDDLGEIRTRVWAPVATGDGTVVGYLGLSSDVTPIARFLLATVDTSASREIYLFNGEGRLIAPSRFETNLAELGLLEPGASSVGLRVADPGRDLRKGGTVDPDAPLTRMAASATAGENGFDVDGYRDYRGVTVVGAWRWIDQLGVGLAAEVDKAEAFAVFSSTRRLWTIAAGVLTGLTLLLAATFLVTASRLSRTTNALRRLSEGLEREVEQRTEELTASRAQLQAEAAVKDDLIAAVSHELRTPLSGVIGFASVALESQTLDAPTRDLFETILGEGKDMADIVDDLTAISRLSTNTLRLDLSELDLLEEATRVVRHWDPANASRIEVSGSSATAVGDRARTRQVIRNLLSNALRYGGPTIEVKVSLAGPTATLTVGDDGPPLHPDVEANMFDLYFRGSSDGLAPSMGIGLGLSWRLADAMGGALTFRRTDDRNTFTLSVPAAIPAAASISSASARVDR
ncbi:MAG TPA: sensor histidine kinase [Acidimicrobiia bacterium]|nr:sensor histidine kinase [Acidimicrobiia bacterium]